MSAAVEACCHLIVLTSTAVILVLDLVVLVLVLDLVVLDLVLYYSCSSYYL
eukprot:COSAG05_NODE_577_length_8579_cov_1071.651651_1_plen_51_part_00